MLFVKGEPSANPRGRPLGSVTSPELNKSERRVVIRQSAKRARTGDQNAVDVLALLLVQSGQGVGT